MEQDVFPAEQFANLENEEELKTQDKIDWLIFTVNEMQFALPSSKVKEILRDSQVFSVPFVPPYISGVLNRYGDPYCVLDPALLTGQKPLDTLLFLVINDSSHTCFRITDVKEFFSASESEINKFSDSEISEFYEGTITYQGTEVFVLKLESIIEKMEKDFASA